MAAKRLWTEVYRPKTIDGYVFQNDQQKQQIERMIADRDIPHLLLTGTQGSGKSTIAGILTHELGVEEVDILKENGSNKTGVDYIRDTILNFAESYPIGMFKVVLLEEFDRLSPAAQDMLRDVMETNSDTCRFICTGNQEHRIILPLKSRLHHMRFKAPARDDVFLRCAEILLAEEVEFEPEILDKYVAQAYPDIRKIIGNLQQNVFDKKLAQPTIDVDGDDYQFKLLDQIMAGDLRGIRKSVTEQCTAEQLEEVYQFLYRNLHLHPKFKDVNVYEQGLCFLLEGVYKHSQVAIPHLNFEAMCIKLCNSIGE